DAKRALRSEVGTRASRSRGSRPCRVRRRVNRRPVQVYGLEQGGRSTRREDRVPARPVVARPAGAVAALRRRAPHAGGGGGSDRAERRRRRLRPPARGRGRALARSGPGERRAAVNVWLLAATVLLAALALPLSVLVRAPQFDALVALELSSTVVTLVLLLLS